MTEQGQHGVEDRVGELVQALHQLAQDGELAYEDPACLALFGVARDCAFQLEQQLEVWRRCPKMRQLGADLRSSS
jgi:hypothetical protein